MNITDLNKTPVIVFTFNECGVTVTLPTGSGPGVLPTAISDIAKYIGVIGDDIVQTRLSLKRIVEYFDNLGQCINADDGTIAFYIAGDEILVNATGVDQCKIMDIVNTMIPYPPSFIDIYVTNPLFVGTALIHEFSTERAVSAVSPKRGGIVCG